MKIGTRVPHYVTVLGMSLMVCACAPKEFNQLNQNESPSTGIVGGTPVESSDAIARSTVALYYGTWTPDGKVKNYCTGTLISRRIVVTAAHCIADAAEATNMTEAQWIESSRVGFGTELVQAVAQDKVQFIPIARAVRHENYEVGSVSRAMEVPMPDVAVLYLEQNAPSGYQPVQMEESSATLQKDLELTLAGYGYTNGMFRTPSKELRKVKVTVDNPRITTAQFTYKVIDSRSACSGDSGGPAYIHSNGRLKLVGITSWGDNFCQQIGAYTSVPAFAGWIRSHALAIATDH